MGLSHVICACQPWQLAAVHCAVHLGRVPPPIAKRESWKLAHAAATTTTTTDCEQITKHQFPQGRATTTTTTVSTTVESGKMSLMYGVSGIGSTLAVVGACELVPAQPLLDCLRQPRKSVVGRCLMLTEVLRRHAVYWQRRSLQCMTIPERSISACAFRARHSPAHSANRLGRRLHRIRLAVYMGKPGNRALHRTLGSRRGMVRFPRPSNTPGTHNNMRVCAGASSSRARPSSAAACARRGSEPRT